MNLRHQIQRIALRWPAYGYRRVHAELLRQGWSVNHKRILRLMREDNLLCLRRRKFLLTTDSSTNRHKIIPSGLLCGVLFWVTSWVNNRA